MYLYLFQLPIKSIKPVNRVDEICFLSEVREEANHKMLNKSGTRFGLTNYGQASSTIY